MFFISRKKLCTANGNRIITGPPHGYVASPGPYAFAEGSLTNDGKVVLSPYRSTNVCEYDPVSDTVYNVAHGETTATTAYAYFYGAATLNDGRVALTPYGCAYNGFYNPATKTYSRGSAHGRGDAAFAYGKKMPNGSIIMSPINAGNIGLLNSTGVYSNGPALASIRGRSAIYNNKVYLPANNEIGIYDIATNTVSSKPGYGNMVSATLMNTGKIFCQSANTVFTIYDPADDTYITGSSNTSMFRGSVLMDDGRVFNCPTSGSVGIYDPYSNTFELGPAVSMSGSDLFLGCVAIPGSKRIVLVPYNSPNIMIFEY